LNSTNTAVLKIYKNPLDIDEYQHSNIEVGTRVIEVLKKHFPKGFDSKTKILLNDDQLLFEDYDIKLRPKDSISVLIYPKGAETGAGALLGGLTTGLAITAGLTDFLTRSAQEIFTPDIPSLPVPDLPSGIKSPGGNAYNLRAQSNIARLGEPIPTQYGKFKWYPDLAAAPYYNYVNNEKFIYQLFCLGWGQFDIETVRLGQNNLDSDSYRLYEPNQLIALFEDNVYNIPDFKSLELKNKNLLFRESEVGHDYHFNYSQKTITAQQSDQYFNELLQSGDMFDIVCDDSTFNGTFEVQSVTNGTITIVDVTSWGGSSSSNPGQTKIYPHNNVKYLRPGYTDLDYPNDTSLRDYYVSTSDFIIINPNNTEIEQIWLNIRFPNGMYDNTSGQYANTTVQLKIILYAIEEDGDFTSTPTDVTNLQLENRGNNQYHANPITVLNLYFHWDPSGTFTFYENGVEIPSSDIASIDYGTTMGGAHVVFNTPKSGTVTMDGRFFVPNYNQIQRTINITKNTLLNYAETFPVILGGAPPVGRYKATIQYMTSNGLDDDIVNNLIVENIYTQMPRVGKFGPYSMLAVKIGATEGITTSDTNKINVIATRKLAQYNGTSWDSPAATRSIVWAFADVWMSTYGASRPFSNLDLTQLMALDTIYTSRGDTFDGVFDFNITVWEALSKIARAGRAKPIFDNNKLSLIRDSEQTDYTAVFGPHNMLPGSFSIDYNLPGEQSPDGITLKYFDEDNNYETAEVKSSNDITRSRTVDLFGCVNYEMAWRESQYLNALMKYSKLRINFKTEMAGHIPFIGDLISIAHDMPNWGQSGYVDNKTGTTITTSEELDWSGTPPFYMSFMKPNGDLSGPHSVTQGTDNFTAILGTDVTDFTFITERTNKNLTPYHFGPSSNWNKACIVQRITPDMNNVTCSIEAIPYIQAVYDADTGTPPTKPSTAPDNTPKPPKIGGLLLTNVPQSGIVNVAWNPLVDIDSYKVQKSINNQTWTDVSTPSIPTESISATGLLYVRVASVIGSTIGEYSQSSIQAT
jgi:hypothetical protein